MATLVKTPSNTWKAVIRKRGWPTTIKTFRTRRDAQDWARRTEDDMVRGVHIDRSDSDRLLLSHALDRYLREVSSTKRATTAYGELQRSGNQACPWQLQPCCHHTGPVSYTHLTLPTKRIV